MVHVARPGADPGASGAGGDPSFGVCRRHAMYWENPQHPVGTLDSCRYWHGVWSMRIANGRRRRRAFVDPAMVARLDAVAGRSRGRGSKAALLLGWAGALDRGRGAAAVRRLHRDGQPARRRSLRALGRLPLDDGRRRGPQPAGTGEIRRPRPLAAPGRRSRGADRFRRKAGGQSAR